MIDPYLQCLDIPQDQRPPDHYALLGIPKFESDAQQIDAAAENRMVYLRSLQTGPLGQYSQRLLNEVAQAKLCLLDAAAKSAYDAQLQASEVLLPTPAESMFPPSSPTSSTGSPASQEAGPYAPDDPRKHRALPWRPFVVIAVLSIIGFGCFYGFGRLISYLQDRDKAELDAWMLQQDEEEINRMTKLSEEEHAKLPHGVKRIDRHYKLVANNATSISTDLVTENSDGRKCISGWSKPGDKTIWELSVSHPGFYRATFSYSLDGGDSQQTLIINTNGISKRNTLRSSEGTIISDECIIMLKEKGTSTIEVSTDGVSGTLKLMELDVAPRR